MNGEYSNILQTFLTVHHISQAQNQVRCHEWYEDTIKGYSFYFGTCFGVLVDHTYAPNPQMKLLVEDDGYWYVNRTSCDTSWCKDIIDVLKAVDEKFGSKTNKTKKGK